MIDYVNGFCFNSAGDKLVLIHKKRPKWMAGMLNGVGGKIEAGESCFGAMIREFAEEAGVTTRASDWTYRMEMIGEDWWMHLFTCFSDDIYNAACTTEDEEIIKLPVSHLLSRNVYLFDANHTTEDMQYSIDNVESQYPLVPNLKWIIPMMLDRELEVWVQTIDYRGADV